jgi:hypothetical protein
VRWLSEARAPPSISGSASDGPIDHRRLGASNQSELRVAS